MYPTVFEIRLDDESKRFYPGQIIAGKVIVVLQKEKIVRGMNQYHLEQRDRVNEMRFSHFLQGS